MLKPSALRVEVKTIQYKIEANCNLGHFYQMTETME